MGCSSPVSARWFPIFQESSEGGQTSVKVVGRLIECLHIDRDGGRGGGGGGGGWFRVVDNIGFTRFKCLCNIFL